MASLLKSLFTLLCAYSLAYADTFVQTNQQKAQSTTNSARYSSLVSPLTPFDEALKKEMQKYPKDSAFFVDGRTGKILSVNALPNLKNQPQTQNKTTNSPNPTQDTPTRLAPYQMQEERIELLQ